MGFLDQIRKGVSVTATPEQPRATRVTSSKNPVVSDLRLYANGAIYPSASLVKKFNLEFTSRDDNNTSNGFDIIDSAEFGNTANSNPRFLMVAPVSKSLPKVDLFDSCRYDTTGNPLVTVMEQGSTTYGKQLLETLKTVYGTTVEKGGYVDLDFVRDEELQTTLNEATNGIFLVPKEVTRGEKKGAQTYIRRENLELYVLIPHSLNNDGADMETSKQTTQTETNKVNA